MLQIAPAYIFGLPSAPGAFQLIFAAGGPGPRRGGGGGGRACTRRRPSLLELRT